MGKEIERKFLVHDTSIIKGITGTPIIQAYVAKGGLLVRVRRAGEAAFLTLKGPTQGISRDEFEYQIPLEDALAMLEGYGTGGKLSKTRYLVPVGGHTFEVDVFEGPLEGLVIAEVELESENVEVSLPNWLGPEVSADHYFANSNLANQGDGDRSAMLARVEQHFENAQLPAAGARP
jgi:adenylate cyclase